MELGNLSNEMSFFSPPRGTFARIRSFIAFLESSKAELTVVASEGNLLK